jgi:hypothetical protein
VKVNETGEGRPVSISLLYRAFETASESRWCCERGIAKSGEYHIRQGATDKIMRMIFEDR